jgi:hypothetical protein
MLVVIQKVLQLVKLIVNAGSNINLHNKKWIEFVNARFSI